MATFMDLIYSSPIYWSGVDTHHWNPFQTLFTHKCHVGQNGSGTFDVFSYYKAIHGTYFNSFPWKSIWHVKAPRGVSFFCVDISLE